MSDPSRLQQRLSMRAGLLAWPLSAGFAWLIYQSGLLMVWTESEEYGHGLMVLGVLAYVIWRRRDDLCGKDRGNGWLAIMLALLGLLAVVLGQTSGISLIGYYGIWLFACAVVFALGGWLLFARLLAPLLIVLLLFPLPNPLGPALTSEMQLVSSRLGVWFIRLAGGVVHLEGNVIDMGGRRLLVAEACSGLRYLFPLMSLGAIAAYVLRASFWIRACVFLSTVPITIFMNSVRIGVTGWLVENWGLGHTEGFLHFFEGWVVFLAATLLLLLVVWILLHLQPGAAGLLDSFSLPRRESGSQSDSPDGQRFFPESTSLRVIAGLVLAAAVLSTFLGSRGEVSPERKPFSAFPVSVGEWHSRVSYLPPAVEQVAGASDYYFGDFLSSAGEKANLYIAYYESQRHGQVPHSPKVCVPGGGWEIESITPLLLTGADGRTLEVNRMVSAKGANRVLIYFWVKQGPLAYREEAMARLDLLRTSLLDNRTDGALIRVMTDLAPGEGPEAADARLSRFIPGVLGVIPDHVPD